MAGINFVRSLKRRAVGFLQFISTIFMYVLNSLDTSLSSHLVRGVVSRIENRGARGEGKRRERRRRRWRRRRLWSGKRCNTHRLRSQCTVCGVRASNTRLHVRHVPVHRTSCVGRGKRFFSSGNSRLTDREVSSGPSRGRYRTRPRSGSPHGRIQGPSDEPVER